MERWCVGGGGGGGGAGYSADVGGVAKGGSAPVIVGFTSYPEEMGTSLSGSFSTPPPSSDKMYSLLAETTADSDEVGGSGGSDAAAVVESLGGVGGRPADGSSVAFLNSFAIHSTTILSKCFLYISLRHEVLSFYS